MNMTLPFFKQSIGILFGSSHSLQKIKAVTKYPYKTKAKPKQPHIIDFFPSINILVKSRKAVNTKLFLPRYKKERLRKTKKQTKKHPH